ncbi:LysR family transcriptional regulator [Pseudorhodoplanes sp.]|uniref:LysR family transcriptional regulator n=1 Tax=Pseudorhodoplanes sp. TaxID=1934341 RepID=UPI003D12C89B
MDTRKLKYFMAVAEELHFGRAAIRLKMSQPPLSQQIQAFERELGVQLFIRNRREVRLTPAGEILLNRAQVVLQELEKISDELREADSGEAGELRLGHAPPADFDILPSILSKLRAQAPRVRLSLRSASTVALLEEIKARRLHAAIIRLPVKQPSIQAITISRERLVAIVPLDHAIASRRTIRFRDLGQHRLVGFPRWLAPAYFDLLSSLCREYGGFTYEPVQLVETIQTALALVAGGLGVSLQAASVGAVVRRDVKCISIADSPLCIEAGIAFSERDRSPVLRNFLHIARTVACAPSHNDKISKAAVATT